MEQVNNMEVEVAIVGGGICGILAAHRCVQRQIKYILIEKDDKLTGVWQAIANEHSQLQVI